MVSFTRTNLLLMPVIAFVVTLLICDYLAVSVDNQKRSTPLRSFSSLTLFSLQLTKMGKTNIPTVLVMFVCLNFLRSQCKEHSFFPVSPSLSEAF